VTSANCLWSGLLCGLRLEQSVNRLLGIGDDEAFFFGPALTLFRSGRLLCSHGVLSSSWFLFGHEMVPQPGIGPGRPEWARDCKSRLSAASSTGALFGGRGPIRTGNRKFCRPLLYRIELRAHQPGILWLLPRDAQLNSSSKRDFIVREFDSVLRPSPSYPSKIVCYLLNLFLIGQPRQNSVNGSGWVLLRGEVKTHSFESLHDILCGHLGSLGLHDLDAGVCNSQRVRPGRLTTQRGQRRNCASEVYDLPLAGSRFISRHRQRYIRIVKIGSRLLQSDAVSFNLFIRHNKESI
jgi:hypothetical protein